MQDNDTQSKIVISAAEVDSVKVTADPLQAAKLPRAIPVWARLVMLPLVLFLPLLSLVALVMRIALRATAPRTQQAWHSYLLTLMIAASFVFALATVLVLSYVPGPPQAISAGLSDFDERDSFPALPTTDPMSAVEIARQMKPLVMVASPAGKLWFGRGEVASNSVGAAVLLQANANGYLFATAKHVAGIRKGSRRVLLTTSMSGWAGADVIAWHKSADLALLWIPRHFGEGEFVQPLAAAGGVQAGVPVFVIGHPEGLNFTLSNGMVSRLVGDTVQITAPVSPGNSGGPVYDEHGNLIAIVIAKMDRNLAPNAENLNFAAGAALLGRTDGWDFVGEGRQRLNDYINGLKKGAPANND